MAEKVPSADSSGLIPAAVLRHVPGCEAGEAPYSVSPLLGGRFNRAHLVRTARGRFVVRLHDPDSHGTGIDRRRELLLHGIAAEARIAPRIVAADALGGFLVLEYIEGRPWSEQSFGRLRELRELSARLRSLHELTPPAAMPRFEPWRMLEHYAARVIEHRPQSKSTIDRMMQRAAEALETSQTARRPTRIVHHDLNHTNLLVADRLYFLDWEYANVADPALDAACIIAYYPRTMTHASMLLEATGLRALGVTPLMLSELARAYELMIYLWHALPENIAAPHLSGIQSMAQIERKLLADN
jgi:thiamine kinase-like enzyme